MQKLETENREGSEHLRLQQLLQTIHQRVAKVVGEDYFRELVSQLGQLLDVRYAIVSRLEGPDSASVLALWTNGEFISAPSYSLAGTPCCNVTQDISTCIYPSGIQEQFPDDHELVEMGAESYLGTPVFHPSGEVIGLLVVMDDKVMEDLALKCHALEIMAARAGAEMVRRDAEEALRDSENHFRTLLEQSPVAKIIFSPEGLAQTFNRASCELLSIPRESIQNLIGRFNIRESTYFQKLGYGPKIEASFTGEAVTIPEFQLEQTRLFQESQSCQELWVKLKLHPLRDRRGEISSVVLVIEDVTQHKISARQSAQLSERLSLALRAGAFGVWDWQVQDNVLVWDDSMYEIYGVAPEEFGGAYEAWESGVHPEDMEACVARLTAALKGTESFDTQFRIVRPNGEIRHIGAHAVVLRDPQGNPIRMIGVNNDITEQNLAQLEKEQLQVQLDQARRMESVGRLAGGVAHDFNNMLSVIVGNVELLLHEQNKNSELARDLGEIHEAALRSAELTHQLLAFAREQPIDPVPLDLNPVVESVFKMLERLVGGEITLFWQPEPALWSVLADASQMDQVIVNLCVNARDAIGGAGQVTLATRNLTLTAEDLTSKPGATEGEYVELSVGDNGCGMDDATVARVFEPFFTTKAQGKGTGLGLATVYGIVKQNGGYIYVDSAPRQGTKVSILLPRCLSKQKNKLKSKAKADRGFETILLVEDQQQVMKVAKRMLENLGYRVIASTNPVQALSLAQETEEEIDLLLTDILMPEMNGGELAERLLLARPGLRCLFMSGYADGTIAEHAVLIRDSNFLNKPFSQSQLATKVREMLEPCTDCCTSPCAADTERGSHLSKI